MRLHWVILGIALIVTLCMCFVEETDGNRSNAIWWGVASFVISLLISISYVFKYLGV